MKPEKRRRAARWLSGTGVEIGALHNPLVVPPGVKVKYVDRATTEELRAHYPELADKALVPISYIGDAHDLSAIADASLDFVIANHLIEHLENPIRGLKEMTRVLRCGGILYIALPDPRVSFDKHRRLTSVEHLVGEFRTGPAGSKEEHFRDWVNNVEAHVEGMPQLEAEGRAERVRSLLEMDYSIHYHVWRPDTFVEFLVTACREAQITLEPLEFIPCMDGADNEFIFVFAKDISPLPPHVPPLPSESVLGKLSADRARSMMRSLAHRVRQPVRRN